MDANLEELDPSIKTNEEFEKFDTPRHSESDTEDEDDEGDFTFACAAEDGDLSFSAEDMFDNGKIKPVFPLFDQSLVFTHDLSHMPPVKNIFVESSAEKDSEATGPTCAWSRKAVEISQVNPAEEPETCKKSNSTGFSKIWRFKEMTNRSHSDGRDTFVFLNKSAQEKKTKGSDASAGQSVGRNDGMEVYMKKAARDKKAKDIAASGGERDRVAMATKKKGGGKGKTVVSAHEVYAKNKAAMKEEDRRKSYLPYKPELVGFFTNVTGGMSKNIHPF